MAVLTYENSVWMDEDAELDAVWDNARSGDTLQMAGTRDYDRSARWGRRHKLYVELDTLKAQPVVPFSAEPPCTNPESLVANMWHVMATAIAEKICGNVNVCTTGRIVYCGDSVPFAAPAKGDTPLVVTNGSSETIAMCKMAACQQCDECKGSGRYQGFIKDEACETCKGTGTIALKS